MAFNLSFFLLGLNVNLGALVSDSGGLPAGATAYADFMGGTYYYGGNAFSDFLYDDEVFWGGPFPPEAYVPGVGVVNNSAGIYNASISPGLAAAITLAGGCTLVIDFTGGTGPGFKILMEENPGFSQELKIYFTGVDNGPVMGDYNDTTTLPPIADNTAYRVSVTFAADHLAASINGGAVTTYAVTDPFTVNYMVFSFNGLTWKKLTVYPIKADGELAGLSTL